MVERRPDRRLFIGSILDLDDCQRQTVDEDHYIRTPVDLAVLVRGFHSVLIDDQPVIIFNLIEIHRIDPPANHAPIFRLVVYFNTIDQHVMEGVVVEQERWIAETHDLS